MKNSLINYLEYKYDASDQDVNKSCENVYERSQISCKFQNSKMLNSKYFSNSES